MAIEITFLGTGTSQGVPVIGCDCNVCVSSDPRDKRTRTSALVTLNKHNVLIDTGPDLRSQCLANNVKRIDAILITHTHADHIFGLDDIRRFNQIQGEAINLYTSAEHMISIEKIFGYARADRAGDNPDLPHLKFISVEPGQSFDLFGYPVTPLPLPHGRYPTMGYRIGNLAYCTDLSAMPDDVINQLRGLNCLVLGALRPKKHPKHLSFKEAVDLARKIAAQQTWLVHMSHNAGHNQQDEFLPPNIRFAYDGLTIKLP